MRSNKEIFEESTKRVRELPLAEFLKLIRDLDLKGYIKFRKVVDGVDCPGTQARLDILEEHIKRLEIEKT